MIGLILMFEYVTSCGIWLNVYWGSVHLLWLTLATWLLCCTGIYGSSSRGLNWASFRHVCCRNSHCRVWLVRHWHCTTSCNFVSYMRLSIATSESLKCKLAQFSFCHAHDDRTNFEIPSAILLGKVCQAQCCSNVRHCKTPSLGKVYMGLDIE